VKNLKPTYYLNFKHAEIQNLLADIRQMGDPRDQAIALYHRVRDGWRYNPYRISLDPEAYRASTIAGKSEGHCIEKAILLTSCLRALGIPARLQLAKVKNHIGVERLVEKFGTNELTPHGMVNLFLNGKWIKVSPAFNRELCQKCHVDPLDFDGDKDSVFQQYTREGTVFMEYLEDYGSFDDVPLEFIFNNFKAHYPELYESHKEAGQIQL
jgi:transglutaminase-like putative cysteine protease